MNNYQPKPTYYNLSVLPPIIGKSVSLNDVLLDCVEQITIGDYVSFGHRCMVLTGQHDYTKRNSDRQQTTINKPITIKDGVWIASGVIICQGVTIGENSVIGAGSVVLHDVPPNELWAGQPAVFKKKL